MRPGISQRAFACFFGCSLISLLPGCTVIEEVLGDGDTAAEARPLEPAAPPPASATDVRAFAEGSQPAPGPMTQGTPPLVVIRFDKPDIAYERPLYEAMTATLAVQPGAMFYVVAIAPPQDTAETLADAQDRSAKNIERVVKTMTQMGLPASRITVASTTNAVARVNEVRVFAR